MRKDLDLLVGVDEERLFNNLKMKLVRTATGFYLGMQVERVSTNGGEIRFKPTISPPEATYVTIGLSIANPYFGAISNTRLDRDVDKIYYFTNEGVHDDISLAKPIGQLVPGQRYRMGDLALVAGSVKQAIVDNTGNARFWSTVGGKGLINQGDRSLDLQANWYINWRSTVRLRSKHPAGVIRIALMSGNGQLSPIDEKKLLTTKLYSNTHRAKHPVYELRWLSRSTYWRYRKRDGFLTDERERIVNGAGSLFEIQDDKFVTKDPRPITRERSKNPWPGATIKLPSAQPGSIKAEDGRFFSDIEFNELNPVPKVE
jgi:hypothetical protein